jgi:hypothetical protein
VHTFFLAREYTCHVSVHRTGKPLPEDETEYVNGVLKASALVTKNKKEHNLHKRKVALDDKKKKRDEKKKASEPKEDIETLELGDVWCSRF